MKMSSVKLVSVQLATFACPLYKKQAVTSEVRMEQRIGAWSTLLVL